MAIDCGSMRRTKRRDRLAKPQRDDYDTAIESGRPTPRLRDRQLKFRSQGADQPRVSGYRLDVPRFPTASTRWIDRWLAACSDLVELERSNPMTDAVIEEVDGRMIRIGDQWLADFASCNYLGFDLDREIIDAVPEYLERWGTHPELVADARQPRSLRADRGAPD